MSGATPAGPHPAGAGAAAAAARGSKLTADDDFGTAPAAVRFDRPPATTMRLYRRQEHPGIRPRCRGLLARQVAGGRGESQVHMQRLLISQPKTWPCRPFRLTLAPPPLGKIWRACPRRIILAEAVIYLASAPKSNSAYRAVDGAAGKKRGCRKSRSSKTRRHRLHIPSRRPRHWVPQQYGRARRYYFGRPGVGGRQWRAAEQILERSGRKHGRTNPSNSEKLVAKNPASSLTAREVFLSPPGEGRKSLASTLPAPSRRPEERGVASRGARNFFASLMDLRRWNPDVTTTASSWPLFRMISEDRRKFSHVVRDFPSTKSSP